jgi:hypothetical protein
MPHFPSQLLNLPKIIDVIPGVEDDEEELLPSLAFAV